MKGMLVTYLRDRLLYLLFTVFMIGLSVGFMLLEKKRNPEVMDLGTIYYYLILVFFVMSLWLAIDYIRQRPYYKQLQHAIKRSSELQAATIIHSAITREQRLVAYLLEEQHSAYLNELRKFRRQQEIHNHFVMQWVHHMKTPISVVDLLAQEALQQMPTSEEERKQLVVSMREEAERMARGLDMMLYTARLDKFEIDLHIKKTPLHKLIRTVINEHKHLCIRHSIFPRIDGEAWVETDKKWITVVLNQFISNAIKYSKSKSGTKHLVFCIEPNLVGGCKLSVTDEGIGISPHDLSRVFDPFFTGENGRAMGESTGMGLYLAKQVCDKLGHELSVTSVLGVGTTFTIVFKSSGIHVFDDMAGRDNSR